MKKTTLILVLIFVAMFSSACWVNAKEGEVVVRTMNDKFDYIIRPEMGGVYSYQYWFDEYYHISALSTTQDIDVTGGTSDKAGVTIKVQVSYHLKTDDDSVRSFVDSFGLNEQHARLDPKINGAVNDEAKDALSEITAYELLANQSTVNTQIKQRLTARFSKELFLEIETVQIIGRPDFQNDDIEMASSKVVANQQLKAAAEAALAAAKVTQQQKEIESQIYSSPALLEIRKLELTKDIAAELRQHSGTLVLGGNSLLSLGDSK